MSDEPSSASISAADDRVSLERGSIEMKKEEFYIRSTDKHTKIHGIWWKPEREVSAVLQITHGMMEHIDRYDRFATWMAEHGIAVVGHDHLGHGKTGAVTDLSFFGESKGSAYLVQDLLRVTKLMKMEYPDVPHVLMGHSMGSFITRRYLTVHGRQLDGAILMGTGGQPLMLAVLGKVAATLIGAAKGKRYRSPLLKKMVLGSYNRAFKPNRTTCDWLSRDEDVVDAYTQDPYCDVSFTCQAYVDFFNILIDLGMKRQFQNIPKEMPLLLISGEDDPVGDFGKGVEKVYDQFVEFGMEEAEIKLYPHARHEILNELNREEVFADIYHWIKDRCVLKKA